MADEKWSHSHKLPVNNDNKLLVAWDKNGNVVYHEYQEANMSDKYVDEIYQRLMLSLLDSNEGKDSESPKKIIAEGIRQAQLDVLEDVAQTVREMTPQNKKTPAVLQKVVEQIYEKVRELKEGLDE